MFIIITNIRLIKRKLYRTIYYFFRPFHKLIQRSLYEDARQELMKMLTSASNAVKCLNQRNRQGMVNKVSLDFHSNACEMQQRPLKNQRSLALAQTSQSNHSIKLNKNSF